MMRAIRHCRWKAASTWPTTPPTRCVWPPCGLKGYRASNRYIVFQVLPHTLGLGPEVWRVLDLCHNRRNLGEYEGLLDVDERLVNDLITATQRVADALPAG